MVEFKPLYTGILEAGRHEVYTCPADKRADVIILRLKNKAVAAAEVAIAGLWDGENDIEQFPDGYLIQPGQVLSDLNFKLFFDGAGKLVVTIGVGGLIHCYFGGMERTK